MAVEHLRRWALALAGGALLSACTASGGAAPEGSPLPTSASRPPMICGFVAKSDVSAALGGQDLDAKDVVVDGGVQTFTGSERNADGGRLHLADCSVTLLGHDNDNGFGVAVYPLAMRPDLVQQAVDDAAGGRRAAYRFPNSYGTGIAFTGNGGHVELLRGDWLVQVSVDDLAKGRDHVRDAVALTRQIVAYLKLPVRASTPYPSPRR